jgi:hypothetical protein
VENSLLSSGSLFVFWGQSPQKTEGTWGVTKGQTVIYKKAFLVSILATSCAVLNKEDLGSGHQGELNQNPAERLLSMIDGLEPYRLYTAVSLEEIKASVKEDREPAYLATIQKAYDIRVKEFAGGLPFGESREERIRHVINLICLMDGGWYVAGDDAWNAAIDAIESATNSLAKDANMSATMSATTLATKAAVEEVLVSTRNFSHQEIERLFNRMVEVTALLYVLKFALDDPSNGFEGNYSKVYQRIDQVLKKCGLPDPSIWASQEAWDVFYAQHFPNLTPETRAFLTPYLHQIEKTKLSRNPQA